MNDVTCNLCGADDPELVNEGRDLYLDGDQQFRLVRCRQCGLIYQNPALTEEELLSHYPLDSYELYTGATDASEAALQEVLGDRGLLRRYRRVARHFTAPGRMLDVGCATGTFLAVARARGWEVTGIELNPEASRLAHSLFGLEVHSGTLEQCALPAGQFDVVTMWDVLEHVLDPRATLAEVARVLRPGGMLVAGVPNPDSVEARLFGSSWAGWDRPRHLHLFSRAVLRRYLQEAGFTEISFESFGGRLSVTLLSVGYLCNQRGIAPSRWKPWLTAAYNWPLRLLTWPVYRVAERLGQTTGMTAFARKSGAMS